MIELRWGWDDAMGTALHVALRRCHPEDTRPIDVRGMLERSRWVIQAWDRGSFVGACWHGEHLGVHICVVPEYHRRWATRSLLRKGLAMIRTKQTKIAVQVGTPEGLSLVKALRFEHRGGRHWELEIAA